MLRKEIPKGGTLRGRSPLVVLPFDSVSAQADRRPSQIRAGVPPVSIRAGRSTPFRSEYKAVVYWSRFTALLRKKLNPYRRRDRRRRSLSGCIIPTYNNSRPETSACFIIIIPELLLKLKSTVITSVNQDGT